jgi:general secretion pathway protein I
MEFEELKIDKARQPLNPTGFTLLEVMVAVSIMAMVLITLLGLKNSSMKDVMLAKHITVATMLAKRMMVENTVAEPGLSSDDEGPFPEPEYKDYTWKKTLVPTPLAQIMELHVAVLWKEGTRDEMVEIVNYE